MRNIQRDCRCSHEPPSITGDDSRGGFQLQFVAAPIFRYTPAHDDLNAYKTERDCNALNDIYKNL